MMESALSCAAFRTIPVPAWHAQGNMFVDNVLPFGLRSACRLSVMDSLVNEDRVDGMYYLDDFCLFV